MLGIGSDGATDWRAIIAFGGIVGSLIWNYVNWHRTKKINGITTRNTEAIRFEAIHSSGLDNATESLRQSLIVAQELSSGPTDASAHKVKMKSEFKRNFESAQNKLVREASGIKSAGLSRDGDRWKKLIDDSLWDEIWNLYRQALGAKKIEELFQNFHSITDSLNRLDQHLLTARGYENSLE